MDRINGVSLIGGQAGILGSNIHRGNDHEHYCTTQITLAVSLVDDKGQTALNVPDK